MHVQSSATSTPSNDLEAMLEAPPQDHASRDARIEEFEANLADAIALSSDEEIVEELIELPRVEQRDEDGERGGHDAPLDERVASAPQPSEMYIAMARRNTGSLVETSSSTPVDDNESVAESNVATLTTSTQARDRANSSVREETASKMPSPPPSDELARSAPVRNVQDAPESTRPAMIDADPPPASPVALERSQGLDRAEAMRGKTEPGKAARVAPEVAMMARTDSRQQGATHERALSPRAVVSASIPEDTVHESTPRSNDDPQQHAQQHSSRSGAEIEWTPHARRPPEDPSLASERPFQQSPASSAPNTVPSPAGVDLTSQGVLRTAWSSEADPQIAPRQPVDALPRQVEMLATQGGGTARMRLHPAQLGEVDITISIRGDAVDVIIHAEEPAARAAVMAHREQLAEALGARELRMEGFDVNGGGRESSGENKQAAWSGAENRRDRFTRPNEMGSEGAERNEIVDRAAQVASVHVRQGIDLRI